MSESGTIVRPPNPPRLFGLARIASHPAHAEIEDPTEFARVLAHDAELADLICEALDHAHAVFGRHAMFQIEVFADSEEIEPPRSIYLVIRTTLDVAPAMQLLDDLFRQWWLKNSSRAAGLLAISLDYA